MTPADRDREPAMGVSVIVVNHDGRPFLGDLFESLARQTRPADEVIMVDNASCDGSVAYTRRHFPWVRVVVSPSNVGFAEGNNIGLAHARGQYLALVNSDTTVDERWLDELMRVLEADERIGAVMGKIYRATAPRVIEQAGACFNNLGHYWTRGYNQPERGQFDAVAEVAGLTACAAVVRRRALRGEPLFDGRLFMYCEEFELSLRLRSRGYALVYVPTAVAHHKGMQSIRRSSRQPLLFQQFYGNRNRVKILAKYYPPGLLLRNLPLIALSLAYWHVHFLRGGGPALLLRAAAAQVHYALQGLVERLRGGGVKAERWLPWMTRQGLAELLAMKAARGDADWPGTPRLSRQTRG